MKNIRNISWSQNEESNDNLSAKLGVKLYVKVLAYKNATQSNICRLIQKFLSYQVNHKQNIAHHVCFVSYFQESLLL